MPTEPAPIVVEASGEFLGNDGAWSTSLIRVGEPPKELGVLVSTEIPETWVVLPDGCNPTSDPSNCTVARGGTYDASKSKNWVEKSIYQLGAEANLGYNQNSDNGEYGFDTLGVAVQGGGNVSLARQLIAGIATKDFFLGNLGLADRSLNFANSASETGFFSQLRSQNLIPSLSYGYTAGAFYRQSNASLTLGGVDASRFTPNDVTFSFADDPLRSKVVVLRSVVATDDSKSETSLLGQPILALVDSTVPHIWLPTDACQQFEHAFGLTHDTFSDFYLVNETTHDALMKRNASISFQLSNSQTTGPSVNITLPYASFDLNISAPPLQNQSRYFPLRRASTESQYTLGRTFFQESFLTVNYESKNFSISQSLFNKDSPSHFVAIPHIETQTATSLPTSSPTSTGSSTKPSIIKTTSPPASHSLGTPAIAGIAIAIVLLLVIAGGMGVWLRIKRKRERKRRHEDTHENTPELAAHSPLPTDRAELEGKGTGQFLGPANDKKGPRSSVEEVSNEKIQTQLDQQEINIMDQDNNGLHGHGVEMSGSEVLTPELPSPDPFMAAELSTPEAELIRSELSTPEPGWPAEMASSEVASTEMPAPEVGSTAAGEPSPRLASLPSPLSSTGSLYPINRTLSRRPVRSSIDSSKPEHWTQDGTAPASASQATHFRNDTAESSRQRPQHMRGDSTDSENTFPSAASQSGRATQPVRVDSSGSEAVPTPPHRRPSLQSRPAHRRLDSKDSSETFETRLEQWPPPPPDAPFFPHVTRVAHDRPIEGLPSLGLQRSQEALVSPSATSTHSGLRSPEPWDRGRIEEDEENAIGSETKKGE